VNVLAIAGVAVRRFLRDRSNIFFVFIFPIALILLIGVSFGGATAPRLAVSAPAGDPTADRILDALDAHGAVEVVRYDDGEGVAEAVERGWVAADVRLPEDLDETIAAGQRASVDFLTAVGSTGPALRSVVAEAMADERITVSAARFAVQEGVAASPDEARQRAEAVRAAVPGIRVTRSSVGEVDDLAQEFAGLGRFDIGATGQLLLFVFLVTLTGSAAMIQTRQLGVAHRMLATPTATRTILGGLVLGWFAVAMVQGGYIMLGAALVFDVNWGDPVAAVALLVAFALVSAGAAMVLGSAMDNDAQAGGLGVFLGLALAALGGSMMPLELFSPTMRRVAMLTPHAWGNEGYAELIRRDGGIVDILPQLGVLALFAVALIALGTWFLNRRLTRA
jgi:ABC-2 type transport system permease protein